MGLEKIALHLAQIKALADGIGLNDDRQKVFYRPKWNPEMKIEMYTRGACPFCHAAKRLLAALDLEYEDYSLDRDPGLFAVMLERTGNRTVPQLIIDGESIGGYQELALLNRSGGLKELAGVH